MSGRLSPDQCEQLLKVMAANKEIRAELLLRAGIEHVDGLKTSPNPTAQALMDLTYLERHDDKGLLVRYIESLRPFVESSKARHRQLQNILKSLDSVDPREMEPEAEVANIGLKPLSKVLGEHPELAAVLKKAAGLECSEEPAEVLEALKACSPGDLINRTFIRSLLRLGVSARLPVDGLQGVFLAVMTHHPAIGRRPKTLPHSIDFPELDMPSVDLEVSRRKGLRSELVPHPEGLRGPGAMHDPTNYGIETSVEGKSVRDKRMRAEFRKQAWQRLGQEGEPDIAALKVDLKGQQRAIDLAKRTDAIHELDPVRYYVADSSLADEVAKEISEEFGIDVARCRAQDMTESSPGKMVEYALRVLHEEIEKRKAKP